MLKKIIISVCLIVLMVGFNGSVWGGVVVIVHTSNATNNLYENKVKKMFLGILTQFPEHGHVVVVEQPSSNPSMLLFHKNVVKKTPAKLRSHWNRLVLSGKGIKPKVLADGAAVKSWVASHAQAIGYIDESLVDDSVKVVLTIN